MAPVLTFAAVSAVILANGNQVAPSGNQVANPGPAWDGQSPQDLHKEYYAVFTKGNRNAASHRWGSFLFERAFQMTEDRFDLLNSGYCAVSGSPVHPSDRTRYQLTLPALGGGTRTGIVYYCCWPCVCDTQDFIKVDTKTVVLADGQEHEYWWMVIGDPCKNPDAEIPWEAPEVNCVDGKLEGATFSDHGGVILAIFDQREMHEKRYQSEHQFADWCEQRKQGGYRSGMGHIFRQVAGINVLNTTETCELGAPPQRDACEIAIEHGQLGINVEPSNNPDYAMTFNHFTGGSDAKNQCQTLRPGMVLSDVNGKDQRGKKYDELMAELQSTRPVRMRFIQP